MMSTIGIPGVIITFLVLVAVIYLLRKLVNKLRN